jgi:hypothetical protein
MKSHRRTHVITLGNSSKLGTALSSIVSYQWRHIEKKKLGFLTVAPDFEEKYYDGIHSSQLSSHDSTRYKWNFAKSVDQHELDSIRDHVDTMTNSQKKKDDGRNQASENRPIRRNVGPSLPSRYASGTNMQFACDINIQDLLNTWAISHILKRRMKRIDEIESE